MRQSLLPVARYLLAALLSVLFGMFVPAAAAPLYEETPANPAALEGYPRDPTDNIKWTGAGDNVTVIEAQFSAARSAENVQLGTFVKPLKMPSQAEWDVMNGGQKALWLINQERTARGLAPLDSVEKNAAEVAQGYAEWLLRNNAWGHNADGSDPWKRLDSKPAIAACHDFLGVAENLAVSMSTNSTPNRIAVERAIFDWMYDDKDQSLPWGHRHALLWTPYADNSGKAGQEGFIGLGHARGAYTYPNDPDQFRWPNTDMIVLNLFDPCAKWVYAAPPAPTPLPTPRPVPTPIPTPGKASVSGKARLPTWVVIQNQTFETSGVWPGAWSVSDANGSTGGDYRWVAAPCRVPENGGQYSGMAVGGGTDGLPKPCDANYPNNARSWMIYGPFSLADAIAAEMRVQVWVYTERNNDTLCMLASTDGDWFHGPCLSGYSNGWVDELFDLNDVYRLDSLLGKSNLYVALAFLTNGSVTFAHQGAYADNLVLRKGIAGVTAAGEEEDAGAEAASPLAGVRITDENGNWAMTDANGNFTLANLSRAKHTLTPSKKGFQFYPPQIKVDLSSGNVGNANCVGTTSLHLTPDRVTGRLYLPSLRRPSASASAAGYDMADETFRMECSEEGCALIGPLGEDGLP